MRPDTALAVVASILMFGFGHSLSGVHSLLGPFENGPASASASEAAPRSMPLLTIRASRLPEADRELLKTLGISDEEIRITPEMLTCAETGIGEKRLKEIAAGTSPTHDDGVVLARCYRTNQ